MTQPPSLYPNEVLTTIAEYPTLYNFQPSTTNSTKPLIICIPGSIHLARIFYGHTPQNFLTHHLNGHGFNVLSISYPIESTPPTMPPTAPHFRIKDWGLQAATTAKMVIEQHALPASVILVGWSMGGRVLVPFTTSARDLGLHVELFISFAGTPGISGIRPNRYTGKGMPVCTRDGYVGVRGLERFYAQVEEMERLNGGSIIPRDVYEREYVGGCPVKLMGLGLKYDSEGGRFVQDEEMHEEDSRVWDFANCPLVSALCPNGVMDASHALADRATWGFILTYQLESFIGKEGLGRVSGTEKWERLLDLVRDAPRRLCWSVDGNHFFFIGEKAAAEVADKMVKLIHEAEVFRKELGEILS